MTTSQGKEIIMSGWKASGIIIAIKKGSVRLPSLDPFNDLVIESRNTEENFDISELDEDQILAFTTRDDENKSDDEGENLYYPPDSDGNIFDIFDNDEAL